MDSTRYTSQVQQWHSQVAPATPIDAFVSYLDPELLGLENRAQFYAPVEFAVHVAGPISGAAGAVRLHVPVHANSDWLSILQQRVGAMFGRPVELRTMAGKPLARVPLDELDRAGKLGVYSEDGKRLTLPALPPVPLEYSINKLDTLYQWFGPVKEQLAEKLSKELLRYETPTQLVEAIAPRGPIERSIAAQLEGATNDWREFVRVNHMNSPYSLDDDAAHAVLKGIASSLRSTLSDFVQSSASELSSYYSSVEAERMAQKLGREAQSFKPLFGNMPANVSVRAEDGFSMFNNLVKSMLELPSVADEVVNTIYLKPIEGCRWEKEPERGEGKKPVPKNNDGAPVEPPRGDGEKPVPKNNDGAPVEPPQGDESSFVDIDDPKNAPDIYSEPSLIDFDNEEVKERHEGSGIFKGQEIPVLSENEIENIEIVRGTKKISTDIENALEKLGFSDNQAKLLVKKYYLDVGQATTSERLFLLKNGLREVSGLQTLPVPKRRRKKTVNSSIDQHHPYNAHIHHTIKDIAGSYPSHYMAEHTRRDLTESAPYKGDVDATYASYHTFANAHPMPAAAPVGRLVRASAVFPEKDLAPVGCGHDGRRKKKEEEEVRSALPPLIPIRGDAAPPVRPLKDLAPVESCHGGRHKKRTEQSARDMESALPPLIPIRGDLAPVGCGHDGRRKKKEEEKDVRSALPPLIPIRGDVAPPVRPLRDLAPVGCEDDTDYEEGVRSALPPLIPLGEDLARVECGMRKKKGKEEEEDVRSALPPLVPIHADVAQKMRNRLVRVEAKAEGHGFAGLPEVDDLF